jgi:hypothetical protein
MEVGHAYIALYHDNCPEMPSIKVVAKKANISHTYASLVIEELLLPGNLIDPKIIKETGIEQQLTRFHLTVEEELFLLSLWTENQTQPNNSYARGL